MQESPRAGSIYNINLVLKRFDELINSFKTYKAKARNFIEKQKYSIEDAFEDFVNKFKEHFNVKSLSEINPSTKV